MMLIPLHNALILLPILLVLMKRWTGAVESAKVGIIDKTLLLVTLRNCALSCKDELDVLDVQV